MAEAEFKLSGGIVGLDRDQIKRKTDILAEKFAESAQEAIHNNFNRSVELASFVGQAMDPEAVRAILRGLKVNVLPVTPLQLEAKFHDELGHLYGFEDLPDEISKLLQKIIDDSLIEWSNSDAMKEVLVEVMESEES